jgi:hypothetical protein
MVLNDGSALHSERVENPTEATERADDLRARFVKSSV